MVKVGVEKTTQKVKNLQFSEENFNKENFNNANKKRNSSNYSDKNG
jgi:hypothetical protein